MTEKNSLKMHEFLNFNGRIKQKGIANKKKTFLRAHDFLKTFFLIESYKYYLFADFLL